MAVEVFYFLLARKNLECGNNINSDNPMEKSGFLSTREAAHRLGVSLGTVQNMVEGGVLEAWKTAGGHRRIPVSAVDNLLSRRQQTSLPATSGDGRIEVLIAEDSPTLLSLYQLTMSKWDIPLNVRAVNNGFDGLLEVGKLVPDVLITDLMMPGMDGFEMIRRLRTHDDLGQMDIIVISALGPDEIRDQGGLPADVTVFAKPIPFHELKGFFTARQVARKRPARLI